MSEPGSAGPFAELTAAGWERRCFASHRGFVERVGAGTGGGRLIEHGAGLRASVAPAVPRRSLFNSVVYEDPGELERAYETLAAAYLEAGIEAWTVWLPDGDRRSAALLERAGHSLDGSPQAMALDLEAPDSAAIDAPDGELANTDAGRWEQLCAINDVAYEHEPGTFLAGLGGDGADFRVYIAELEGRAASALATLDTGGDCGICIVATLPEARGRGLAGGLLARALGDARERGCTTSTLLASALGRPVYARLGYRDLGPIQMWERRAPGP